MKKLITWSFIIVFTTGFAQEKYKEANSFFNLMEYVKAAELYEKEFLNGDDSKELLEKIGDSYYLNTDMQSANNWYGKLISLYEHEMLPEFYFRYAQSFKGIGKQGTSKKWMKKFLEIKNNREESTVSDVSLNKKSDRQLDFRLTNLSINTAFSDFGPMYFGNQLIFSSAKDSLKTKISRSYNQRLFSDLFIGDLDIEGADVISKEDFSKKINSNFHEATLCFSQDLKKVYYTRNNYNSKTRHIAINKLKIYSATAIETEGGAIEWTDFRELPFNSKRYSTGHPALSPDGKKLYFVSDMPGTLGETDIFVVDILNDDEYSEPRNLGPNINTTGKEMFPFITEKKLYFSSDGYDGFGGLDVFESDYHTTFQLPVNLGNTLNSAFDDFGYIVKEEANNGFVCSNRNTGKGDDDIYFFERKKMGISDQTIEGYVYNTISGERIANATVSLYLKSGDKLEETKADINGDFAFQQELFVDKEYLIKGINQGYEKSEKTIIPTDKETEIIVPIGLNGTHDFIVEENGLLKIKVGIIYFDLNKYNIRKDAAIEFDKIVAVLNRYPAIIIDIESHTDSRGSDAFNLKLSNKRAISGKNYIISKGIRPDRIRSAKGFGETRLKNKCKNGASCSESMHQLNRRSEFIITRN